jgi:hypothetical protein
MKSEAFGRLVAGPVGSGKTTSMIMELFRRAAQQAPAPDGLRYTRFAIVRQTLSQLKQTVKRDIEDWLKDAAEYRVSENTFYVRVGDIRSEWILIPLEDAADQQRLLSMQLTGSWMSEVIEMDVGLVAPLSGRCGRYPNSFNRGVCSWKGIIADTNMPVDHSDWWDFMENPDPTWQIFKQPGGLSAHAENLDWLEQTEHTRKLPLGHPERIAQGRKYYERLAQNKNENWVKRYVHAEYGNDPSGTAVFRSSFKRSFHVVEDLEPVPGRALIIGQDFGRDPASIIVQLDHKGRLLVLEEVYVTDLGLEQHIRQNLRPATYSPRYLGKPVIVCGDPSGRNRSSLIEMSEFDMLRSEGFQAMPAPTNDIDRRIAAVESFLLEQRDGGPAMLIDGTRCPMLVRALDGGYRYARTKAGIRKATPEKDDVFSHIADALQYACLAARGAAYDVYSRRAAGRMSRRLTTPKFSARAWT